MKENQNCWIKWFPDCLSCAKHPSREFIRVRLILTPILWGRKESNLTKPYRGWCLSPCQPILPSAARWPSLVTHWLHSLPCSPLSLELCPKLSNDFKELQDLVHSHVSSLISCHSFSCSLIFVIISFLQFLEHTPCSFSYPGLPIGCSFHLECFFFLYSQKKCWMDEWMKGY